MAQSGYTPIALYYSSTAAAAPLAGNLVSGELAINIADKKLYAKDSGGNVFVIADASSGGTTATNLAGGVAGSVPYQTAASTTTFLGIGAANYVLTSTGTAPTWTINTGTGNVVRATSPTITTPTITTSATVPLLIGGTTTTSTLTLRSTSGVGTTGADIIFQTGSNGATEAMRVLNSGFVGVGTNAPSQKLTIGTGDLQIDNAQYIRGKIAAGTTTRMLGINASNVLYVGSVDAAVSSITFNVNGTTYGGFDASGNVNFTGNTTLGDATTDTVTVNGYMGIGQAASSDRGLLVRPTALTGTIQYGITASLTATSAATSLIAGLIADGRTAAAAFTASNVVALYAGNTIKGAGSTITSQSGLYIEDQTNATNNYGITSLVSSGTNKWNIYASGTAANYFAGDVGIGTTTLASIGGAYRTVTLNATGGSGFIMQAAGVTQGLVFADSTLGLVLSGTSGGTTPITFRTNNTERMRIGTDGRVGINTTSPQALFHVSVDGNGALFSRDGAAAVVARTGFDTNSDGAFFIGQRARTSVAAPSLVTSGDRTIEIWGRGYDGAAYQSAGRLTIDVDGTPAAGSMPGRMVFFTTPTGTVTPVERMRIDSAGNVGIGTNAPSSPLTVYAGNNQATIKVTNGPSANNVGITLESLGGNVVLNNGNGPFELSTGGSIRAVVTAAGRVGVATTTPLGRLDVSASGGSTANAALTAVFGADEGDLSTRTNATNKVARIGYAHYTTAQSPAAILTATSNSTDNLIGIGGGTGSLSAATAILFYTGATNTTLSGTERMRITSTGDVGIGVVPSEFLDISKTQDAVTRAVIRNASAGVAAQAQYQLSNGTSLASFGHTGTAFTTAGVFRQNGSYISAAGAGGLTLNTSVAQPIYFGTNSTERMRIDSAGSVGIGTTTPAMQLDVRGVSTTSGASRRLIYVADTSAAAAGVGGGIAFAGYIDGTPTVATFGGVQAQKENATTGNQAGYLSLNTNNGTALTERMRIDSAGLVAINTTTPLANNRLHVEQNANANYSTSFAPGTTPTQLVLRDISDVATYTNPFAAVQFGAGNTGAGWSYVAGAREGSGLSFLAFGTGTGGQASERMRITSAGLVGIGITSDSIFTVASTTPVVKIRDLATAATNVGGTVNFQGYTNGVTGLNNFSIITGAKENATAADGSGYFSVQTSSSAGVSAERMRITSSGSVGIGTATPTGGLVIAKANNNGAPILGVTDTGGANNSYLSLYSRADALLFATSKNGTGTIRPIRFAINDFGDATTGVSLALETNGNVGIGTAAPAYPLHLSGTTVGAIRYGVAGNTDTTAGAGAGWAAVHSGISTVLNARSDLSLGQVGTFSNHSVAFYTNTTERMRLDVDGNLLVGATSTLAAGAHSFINSGASTLTLRNSSSAAGRYWFNGPDSGSNFLVYNASSIGVYLNYGSTAWTASSDERVKDIIEPIENAAEKVSSLRAVIGKYKKDAEGTRRSFLIAQDVQAVLPEAVDAQDDEMGTLGVRYTDTIPLLVAAIQELKAEIDALKGAK